MTLLHSTALASLVALAVGGVTAPLVYRLLLVMKSRQTISLHLQEHAHKQGTPTMGGLIILIGLVAGLLTYLCKESISVLILLLGFGLIGFIDDFVVPRVMEGKRGLGWKQKLVAQVACAAGAIWFQGIHEAGGILFSVFVILFFSNAFNFSDGLDALAGGLGVLMALGFASLGLLYAAIHPETGPIIGQTLPIQIALAVSFIPFLLINAPPAKVFMGDVGSLPVGAIFGWLLFHAVTATVSVPGHQVFQVGLGLISFVMAIELVPVPLQIGSVKLRKRRMFNFKTPIHHAFQERGWPETRIVWMFHLAQLILVILALGWVAFLA